MTTEPAPDPVMARILKAVEQFRSGEVEAARAAFAEVWDALAGGDPFHRCVLAHYAADAEPEVTEELLWDLRALEAADEVTDDRVRRYHGALEIAGFYPSLHLNLADDYRRLADADRARHHIDLARQRIGALGDDGYGRWVRDAIERTATTIAAM